MKEEWLKDIHNKMTDYELDEPDNLWEQIQHKMSEEKKEHNRAIVLLWTKRFVAVAAIAILFFSISHYLNKGEVSSAIIAIDVQPEKFPNKEDQIIINRNSSASPFINKKDSLGEKNTNQNTLEKIVSTEKKSPIDKQKKSPNELNKNTLKVTTINKNVQAIDIKTNDFLAKNRGNKFQLPVNENVFAEEIAYTPIEENSSKRISFGVFTSGGKGSSLISKSVDNEVIPSIGLEESTWKDSGLLGTLAFNHGRETETEIKHRLPIRMGVLFNYEITKRIGIESGITYTYLTSDVREGSENYYFTSQQKLHYIGIPFNLRYKVFALRKLEMYSSIGILSEKNISGDFTKVYFIDNQITQTENEKIKINTWQWSATASFGLQYNFSSFFGIYADPGVSYYFKNNTPIETFYTDQPFNFNINFGVRFTFGK
ncbi:MAG: outer membrane beta-barrel protein [Capnocytophaga sp.]|nr:outer membrane beta-barrel protein [Capnocytophaga sp.]